MSQRDEEAARVGSLLGIRYTHALRLIRAVNANSNAKYMFPDLVLACRELKEKEEKRRRNRPRGALPKGAGGVRCGSCDAFACADGKGTPIVLKHDDGCPEKQPITDHRYDAGNPRDDSKGCIFVVADEAFWEEEAICGQPLSMHRHSEYQEDYP